MIKRCLFCGCDTTSCKSVEHIIPESLGNIELILPKGVVRDKCNNYFSKEIENKLLSIQSFRDLCFYELIQNKKERLKNTSVLLCGEECKVDWEFADGRPALLLGTSPTTIENLFNKKPELVISRGISLDDEEHSYEISRFLYKIAVEYYAYLFLQLEENQDAEYFQCENELKKIIDFVRTGNKSRKYLIYESKIERAYVPFTDNKAISLRFYEKDNDLFFEITLFTTKFSLNFSHAVYNH